MGVLFAHQSEDQSQMLKQIARRRAMASGLGPTDQCASGPNNSCQFAGQAEVFPHSGRYYCRFHAPAGAPLKWNFTQLQQIIEGWPDDRIIDLTGVIFPPTTGNEEYRLARDTIARQCTFEAGTRIQVGDSVDISDSACLGDFVLTWVNSKIIAHRVRFSRDTRITCVNASLVDLTDSIVSGHLQIDQLLPKVELRLIGVSLAYAPIIAINATPAAMPQNTSFQRMKLLKTAFGDGAEARYRAIRNLFHASRDREQEGLFYKYEKRAKRKGLTWRWPGNWIPRAVSKGYDLFAGYGQSYGQALAWFVGVQIGFGFLYSVMSKRFGWSWSIDWQVVAFTLAQVVKPFGLLSASTGPGWPYRGIAAENSADWAFFTATDTALSLILVALFLLALRWRFRRD